MPASSNELSGLRLASVSEERVKEVATFQVSALSDFTEEGNLIGLVIYDLDGNREFEIDGCLIKEGYIYFRSPESIVESEGKTFHAKLFYSLFGEDWDKYGDRMTVSGFARQDGEWKRTSRTLNVNVGEGYSLDMSEEMTNYEFENVINYCKTALNAFPKITFSQEEPHIDPVKKDGHSNMALQIYKDLMHIRNDILYKDFTKQAPRLLKLPIISFLVAMSGNQHSAHPVRDSVVDISVESTALIAMGLAIGNSAAAVALFASHLAEKGLEHFPSWDQIDKMPRTTTQERLAFSRMIEVRATVELLLAAPSKATEILSRYVKSVMDLKSCKDLPRPNALAAPLQFLPPVIAISSPPSVGAATLKKPVGLTLFSSFPKSDHKLLEQPKLSHSSSSIVFKEMAQHEIKSFASPSLPKLTGLFDASAPKTGWDTLRSTQPALTRFSLSKQPSTGWDKLASRSSLPGTSLSLLTEKKANPSVSISSMSVLKPKLASTQYTNGWDKLREQGSFPVSKLKPMSY